MPIDLITIGRSGAAAARASLEVTAQNIANAANPDYVRRSLQLNELVGRANVNFEQTSAFSGVQISGITRPDSELLQRRSRDSTSDLARAQAELSGSRDAETALEQSGLYNALVELEAGLTLLESDPTDSALRSGALENARRVAQTFEFADSSLTNARNLLEDEIRIGVDTINGAAAELARINRDLVNAREGTGGRAALLDERDAALRELAGEFGITTQFDQFGAVEVRLTGNPSPAGGGVLVSGSTSNTISASFSTASGASFSLAGSANFSAISGEMAGRDAALATIGQQQSELDTIAAQVISQANTAQAAGAALDGSPGQSLFSGSNASDITLALNNGDQLALAPAGSPAGSRDTTNLNNLINVFADSSGPIAATDRMLLSLSSRVSGVNTTSEGLAIIDAAVQAELANATGVDLNAEAADLIRLQQAFEANSRVIQVASDIFDTILGIG